VVRLGLLDAGGAGPPAVSALAPGNGLYYALGVGLAFRFRDNRAFCKYICPLTVFLKAGARLSVLEVAGDMALCTECGACDRMCPMDIRILD
jgi:ferredoxin-type protein NapH